MRWAYNVADGLLVCGGPYYPPVDPLTQAVEVYDSNPDPRTERWDGTSPTKKRPATAQEIAAFDAAAVEAVAADAVADKRLIAVAEFYRQQLNVVRAALVPPLGAITRAAALDAIKTIWKAL